MKKIIAAYRQLLGILYEESPFIVIIALIFAVLLGVINPLAVWVNGQIFDRGIDVAAGALPFSGYIPYLVAFVILALLPVVMGDMFQYVYIEPRSLLIFRTAFKGRMLQKLKRMGYEHLESEASMEIIDKAYNRAEASVQHLFPGYLTLAITSLMTSAGILYMFATVRWWLLLTILLPYALDVWLSRKQSMDIYEELERFWPKERRYTVLGKMLRTREYIRENRLNQSADYLIDTYQERLAARNREYEGYYFKHLKRQFTKRNLVKLAQLGNAALLLLFFSKGQLSIGLLITLTLTLFTTLYGWEGLAGCTLIIRSSGYHINFFDFYNQYFDLSEDAYGDIDDLPEDFTIEFDNVSFAYPGTDKRILDGLTLRAEHGEKLSIVGENGEGKTTMIKLLLGLFQPDSGEIRIGGRPLSAYSQDARSRMFGPVFQDFVRYSISLGENIGVGDVAQVNDRAAVDAAMKKAGVDGFAATLPDGPDTLLGREFEGGVDLSGGQWQRIAIARAFMGDKPILILDEPTSQLDPMAESRIYSEFAEMAEGKTALFITHRLGSTVLTDRILVISGGRVTQNGSHDDLIAQRGLYADMFEAQKQWYIKNGGEGGDHAEG